MGGNAAAAERGDGGDSRQDSQWYLKKAELLDLKEVTAIIFL